MKKCGRCLDFLEENEFSFRKGRLQSFCKKCQKEYAKEYRLKNKEKLKNKVKEWRKFNKSERILSPHQKLEEEFRAKMRRLLKRNDDSVDSVFGYSSNDLRNFFLKKFNRIPDKEYNLKYIRPLSEFNLDDISNWREAAKFDNLTIVKKSS